MKIIILFLITRFAWAALESTYKSVLSPETEIRRIEKRRKDIDFSIFNQFEFQNYFTDNKRAKPVTIYTLTPELNYIFPKTKLNVGFAVRLESKLSEFNSESRKMDLSEVSLKAFYPIWKNNYGTSVSNFIILNGYAFSTIDGAWEKFQNRLFTNINISQEIGKVTLSFFPNFAYYITNPNYKSGDMNFRAGIDFRANYMIVPDISFFHRQKYRKYYQTISQYEFLTEYGIRYFYNSWSFDSYVSRYSRELAKLWTLREQKNVWVHLNIKLKL